MTDLAPDALLEAAHALCLEAFDGDFSDDDWEHALGGENLFLLDGDELVAHAAVVSRTLLVGSTSFDVGYVEGVAVRASHRSRRLGHAVMAAAERVIAEQHDLGALSPTDEAVSFYASRGWQDWPGPLAPEGQPGDVMVLGGRLRLDDLDLTATLTADHRSGDLW